MHLDPRIAICAEGTHVGVPRYPVEKVEFTVSNRDGPTLSILEVEAVDPCFRVAVGRYCLITFRRTVRFCLAGGPGRDVVERYFSRTAETEAVTARASVGTSVRQDVGVSNDDIFAIPVEDKDTRPAQIERG